MLPPAFQMLVQHLRSYGGQRRAWMAIEVAGAGPNEFELHIPEILQELGGSGPTQSELEELTRLGARSD